MNLHVHLLLDEKDAYTLMDNIGCTEPEYWQIFTAIGQTTPGEPIQVCLLDKEFYRVCCRVVQNNN